MTRLQLAARMLAPYVAVLVFLVWLRSGWLATLAYHAQALLWTRALPDLRLPERRRMLLLSLPSTLAGPAVFALVPLLARMPLPQWLDGYGLSGAAMLAMVPYFGLVHPLIEQAHWSPLREATPLAHPAFAGYHVVVLWTLLGPWWCLVVFALLTGVSWLWGRVERDSGGLLVPAMSHVAADLGVVLAAVLLSR